MDACDCHNHDALMGFLSDFRTAKTGPRIYDRPPAEEPVEQKPAAAMVVPAGPPTIPSFDLPPAPPLPPGTGPSYATTFDLPPPPPLVPPAEAWRQLAPPPTPPPDGSPRSADIPVAPPGNGPSTKPGREFSLGRQPWRARQVRVAVTAIGLATVAVVAGLLVAGRSPALLRSSSARTEVLAALDQATADRTADVTLKIDESLLGRSESSTGTGALSLSQGDLKATLDVSFSGRSPTSIPIEYVGGAIYEDASATGLGTAKPWVVMSASMSTEVAQGDRLAVVGENPAEGLDLLSESSGQISSIGSSEVDGEPAKVYREEVPAAAVVAELDRAGLPAWVRSSTLPELDSLTFVVFVGDHATLLRYQLDATTGDGDVSETLDFSHYGVPAVITAPPVSQVVDLSRVPQAISAR